MSASTSSDAERLAETSSLRRQVETLRFAVLRPAGYNPYQFLVRRHGDRALSHVLWLRVVSAVAIATTVGALGASIYSLGLMVKFDIASGLAFREAGEAQRSE